jgi:hypothetical protein
MKFKDLTEEDKVKIVDNQVANPRPVWAIEHTPVWAIEHTPVWAIEHTPVWAELPEF